MKYYNRAQVTIIVLFTTILAFLVAYGLGIFGVFSSETTNGDPEIQASAKEKSENEFKLKPNTKNTSEIISINNGTKQYTDDELVNMNTYERLNSAVVNITTEVVAYNWFLEPVPKEGTSGSGSIIDKRGYVLTNSHVVKDAYKVNLTLADGSKHTGKVVGTDSENDLAVVKFDPGQKELNTIPFGSSKNLRVGQKVLAIGNPFAFERTLTTGIVSGLGRPVKTKNGLVIREMIQTDASINPGNSGGPLLDSSGQMIGVNTMIYSPSGGSVGIGFAVPVDTAKRVVPDLIQYGKVRRGWIDIMPVQLFPALVEYADLPVKKGILISRLIDGGNAEQAGLRGGQKDKAVRYGSSVIYLGGDIIVNIDGEEVVTLSDMYGALEDNKPGETVTVKAYRGNKLKEFQVTLSERPEKYQWE